MIHKDTNCIKECMFTLKLQMQGKQKESEIQCEDSIQAQLFFVQSLLVLTDFSQIATLQFCHLLLTPIIFIV